MITNVLEFVCILIGSLLTPYLFIRRHERKQHERLMGSRRRRR